MAKQTGWLWLALACLATAAGLAAYVFLAGRFAGPGLDALKEEARAEGYPTTLGELDAYYPTPPQGANAADRYLEAFAHLPSRAQMANAAEAVPVFGRTPLPAAGQPLPDGTVAEFEAVLITGQRAIGMLRDAAALEESRYPVHFAALGQAVQLPHLAHCQAAARLLAASVVHEAARGQADGAIQDMHAILGVARSLDREPLLISQQVRAACLDVVYDVSPWAFSACTYPPEELAAVQASIEAAADETTRAFTRALAGERALAAGSGPGMAQDAWRTYSRCLLLSTFPVPQAIEQFRVRAGQRSGFLADSQAVLMPAVARSYETQVRTQTRLRAAAAAVALVRYRQAHGRFPERLDALVPTYLDRVPTEPETGLPFAYAVDGDTAAIGAPGLNANALLGWDPAAAPVTGPYAIRLAAPGGSGCDPRRRSQRFHCATVEQAILPASR